MNCRKCGNLLNENDSFCTVCGEPVVAPVVNQQMGGQFVNQDPMSQTISPTETLQPAPEVMHEEMPSQPMPQPMMNQPMNNPQPEMMQQPMNNMQQPEMMQQPMMNQPVNNMQPMNNMPQNYNGMNQGGMMPPKKNNSSFMIIVIILIVAILGLGSFVGYKLISKNDTKVEKKDTTTSKTNSNKDNKDDDKDKDDDKENEEDEEKEEKEPVIADNTNVFESEGYKFIIPNGLQHQVQSSYDYKILLFSNGSTFTANIVLSEYDTEVLEDPSFFKQVLEIAGYSVADSANMTIGGVEYLFYKIYYNDSPLLYYITKLDNNRYVEGAVRANVSTGYDTAMEYVSTMIKSVEKTSTFAPNEEITTPTAPIKPEFIEGINIEGVEYPMN